MKRLLPFVLTAVASAATVPFETSADLTANAVSGVTYGTLTQAASYGAGNPVSGGLRYQGDATANERGAIARKPLAVASTDGIWTTSILVNAREMDGSTADKAEVRLGFAAGDTVPAKPWEYFNKGNDSISVKLKAEHKPADGKTRNLECQLSNRVTTETNFLTLTLNNSPDFDNWLKLTLRLTRSGGSGFTASYTLENLGADGTSAPVLIFDSGNTTLANSSLANARPRWKPSHPTPL